MLTKIQIQELLDKQMPGYAIASEPIQDASIPLAAPDRVSPVLGSPHRSKDLPPREGTTTVVVQPKVTNALQPGQAKTVVFSDATKTILAIQG